VRSVITPARRRHTLGIAGANTDAGICQRGCNGNAGRVAHVVGVGLEGQPEQRDGLSARIVAQRGQHLATHRALAPFVNRDDSLDDADRRTMLFRRL